MTYLWALLVAATSSMSFDIFFKVLLRLIVAIIVVVRFSKDPLELKNSSGFVHYWGNEMANLP